MSSVQQILSFSALLQLGKSASSRQKFKDGLNQMLAQCQPLRILPEVTPSKDSEAFVISDPKGEHIYLKLSKSISDDDKAHLAIIQEFVEQQLIWYCKLERNKKLVYTDDVTGLFNQRFLRIAIKQETERFHRYKQPFSLLFLDIDDFKQVNDRFGHLTGSAILKQFGQCIQQHVRNIDMTFRYGGDEFIVMLVGTVAEEARFIAQRLCKTIAQQTFHTIKQTPVPLTTSIGLASVPEHAQDHLSLLKFADKSMYYSKELGKNRVSVYQTDYVHEAHYERPKGKST